MNKEKFAKYINGISELDNESLSEIKTMLDEFPYFQSAWILYVKNLHSLKDIRYESKLKVASAYISDRKILLGIINDTYNPAKLIDPEKIEILQTIDIQENTDAEEISSSEIENPIIDNIESKVDENIIVSEEKSEFESEPEPEKTNSISVEENSETENVIATETNEIPENSETDFDGFQLVEISDASENLSETSETKIDTETHFVVEDIEVALETGENQESETEEIQATFDETQIKELIEKQLLALGIKSTITFSEGSANIQFEQSPKEKRDEIAKNEPETPKSQTENLVSDTEKEVVSVPNRTKKMNLIDDFLKSDAKIIPDKNYHSNSTLTTESLIEDAELFSEKLAKIYIKQGHLEKALETYEKLYLKYPEKNIYFATQIDYVKSLINIK